MNITQALKKLEAAGSEQVRKIYGRHGVTGPMFGVKYGDQGKFKKEIGVDHDLALKLWASGNHDARVLATMVADPDAMTAPVLKAWVKDIDNYVLSMGVAVIATKSAAGRKLMSTWIAAKGEWIPATGWSVLAGMCNGPDAPSVADAKAHLKTIEARIHTSPNRVKYSMNTALIAMGAYLDGFEATAVTVANRIGQVEVDHGLTSCETPLAAPYIKKAAEHHRKKVAKKGVPKGSASKKVPAKKKAVTKKATKKAASKKAATKLKPAAKKAIAKKAPAKKKAAKKTARR